MGSLEKKRREEKTNGEKVTEKETKKNGTARRKR